MHPLTFPQQSIYLDALLRGATTKFNMGGVIVIRGPLDSELFRRSLQCALAAHDAQRTRLFLDGETALQEFVPQDKCSCPFKTVDISDRTDPLRSTFECVLADIAQPLRLDQFPLHADTLFRLEDQLHVWYPKFHHVANDAYGHSQVASTAADAYNQLLQSGQLPEVEHRSYTDFIVDDRAYAVSKQFRLDQAFWRDRFPAMPEPLPFTARKGELKGDTLRTERCTLSVSRLLYNSVVHRADETDVTLVQLLLACLLGYLSRVTGCDDIVIGTPILNRSNHAFRRTAGMFMNMMPLRLRIERNASIAGLAAMIKTETRACYRHQRFPLGETLRHCRSLDGFCHGVFDVTVIYRKLDYDITFGGSPIRVITLDTGAREETLSLEIDEYNGDDDINLFFNYNPQLISPTEIEEMARAFETLLLDVALDGDRLVREIRLSPQPELAAPRQTVAPALTVVDLVEQRAAESPDCTAVICADMRMTRGELDRRSSRIAALLANAADWAPEQPVAVLCGRTVDWIAAILGILKAGCTYLPLDPEMPTERLQFMLQDSGCRLVLTDQQYGSARLDGVRCIAVADASQCSWPSAARAAVSSAALAYIIYTSGSTGQPKGVLIEHGSLANTVIELAQGWSITERDRVLGFAAPSFDASIVDIFLALTTGAPLVLASNEMILNPEQFVALLRQESVTVATLPPAYLNALGSAELTMLRLLVTAGEAANPADVARHLPNATYVNAYGPTEAAVCASYFLLPRGADFSSARVPIGRPIGNTQILIADDHMQALPTGAIGELCITGAGLARGYLNLPELSAQQFVTNPNGGGRLFRTGDLGRLLSDGNIEFLGRRDAQVKVRGYRVELGEIENALKSDPEVETAVVTAWISAGVNELVAYVVPRSSFEPRHLRRHLAAKLPAYMVPARWIQIATLPVTPAGKVDRYALPRPTELEAGAAQRTFTPPGTALEISLADIWSEILEVRDIGMDDDFFELGGHSLKAIRVISRIRGRFNIHLELSEFFSNPTVASLAAHIQQSSPQPEAPISPSLKLEQYPLSNAQARIWVLSQLEGGLAAYNMPVALDLEGELDVAALERAFRTVITRHESLRTCFISESGAPYQKVVPDADVAFHVRYGDFTDSNDPEGAARALIQEEFSRPFDLSHAPLLRVSAFRITERCSLLSVVVHHIVADGWSLDVLFKELASAYSSSVQHSTQDLPALPIQYHDYSKWMADQLSRDTLRTSREFWKRTLAAPLPLLNLPDGQVRPATLGFTGAIERFALPRAESVNLPLFCTEHRVSPFIVMLTAVYGLLHRYTGDQDIVIGTPVANRQRAELENQIGLYANTLALRMRLGGESTLAELIQRVKAVVLEAHEHQSYPFDVLVQELEVKRSTDRNPLFDVMVVMRDTVGIEFSTTGIRSCEYSVPLGFSVFDLTFHFCQGATGTHLDLEYNTGVLNRRCAKRIAGHLDRMIEALISTPGLRLSRVELLPDEERRLLSEFAEGPAQPPPSETVIDLFTQQALLHPDRTAVLFEGRHLSYADLSGAALRLAARLQRSGVGREAVVALIADRSEWMVAGVIGIMATGAACLPIDLSQPQKRIDHMLKDSGCKIVVADRVITTAGDRPVLVVQEDPEPFEGSFAGHTQLSGVAYITYTSGSTGMPKASLIEHRSLANLVNALGPILYDSLPQPTSELLLTSISFDVAMKQIFGALTRGNTLVVANNEVRHDPEALMGMLVRDGIHLIDLTPSHFGALLANGFASHPKPTLRTIVLGSETLPCRLVQDFTKERANHHIQLFNFYGPSECTVESLYCRLNGLELSGVTTVPIGRPIANSRVYILDPGDGPAPIGVPGEICLGGLPVGRGYLNRPELTASRFAQDPFHAEARIYRTGDRGRWTADGLVEYLGREDGQLKLRGFRIEPGEIEYHLLQHQGVSQAAIVARKSESGIEHLVAYLVPVSASAVPTANELRALLRPSLPDHMLPAEFVILPSLPLTANGKLDRRALPATSGRRDAAIHAVARDALEQRLVGIWETLLSIRPIGLDDSFFDLGGHSLLAMRLVSEVERSFGRRLPLSRFFESPTVASLASLLRGNATPAFSSLVAIRPQGSRPPLFFLPGITGLVNYLYPLAHQLSSETPFYSFQTQALDGISELETTLEATAEHYVCLLLEVQPNGPYYLAGHSFGGTVAFAMGQILLRCGHAVGLLALIDAYMPGLSPHLVSDPAAEDAALMSDLLHTLAEDAERRPTTIAKSPDATAQLHRLHNVSRAHLRQFREYSPDPSLSLPIAIFRASEAMENRPPESELGEDLGWSKYASTTFSIHYIPGDHVTMMSPPHVAALARVLTQELNAVQCQSAR